MNLNEIVQSQRQHWRALAQQHAGTVQAVGSESMVHKHLRYAKLAELFAEEDHFSLHDVGPGVGDFYDWLRTSHPHAESISYSASEITPEYCEIARKRFPYINFQNRDILSEPVNETYDYVILSGVFHQQGNVSHRQWVDYMQSLLQNAWNIASRGMAFNLISSYADFYKPGNYYANLSEVQLFVVRRLSRFFRLDCDYPLFEGTFFVYRPGYLRQIYKDQELLKYLTRD